MPPSVTYTVTLETSLSTVTCSGLPLSISEDMDAEATLFPSEKRDTESYAASIADA